MTVKRYNLQADSLMGVTEHPEGSFIHWRDYERLRDLLRRAAEVVDGCCQCLDYNDVGKEVEQELNSPEQRSDSGS